MRVLYITRNQNYSGYHILKRLIKDEVPLIGIVVPNSSTIFDNRYLSSLGKILYKLTCLYQNLTPCKNTNSEQSLARNNNIPIFKFDTMKSKKFIDLISKINPDVLFLGGGWPELIPESVINMFPNNIYNTHPSLLPEFKGTSITRWQILKGVESSGITIHRVDKNFDTGNIIRQKEYKIRENLTPQQLFKELSLQAEDLVSDLFNSTNNLKDIKELGIKQIKDFNRDLYYKKWTWNWESQRINLATNSLPEIERFIRANNQESYHYIGPHLLINNKLYIIRRSTIQDSNSNNYSSKEEIIKDQNCKLGTVNRYGIEIICDITKSILRIESVQRWDRLLFLRRSKNPNKIFNHKKQVILKSSPVLPIINYP